MRARPRGVSVLRLGDFPNTVNAIAGLLTGLRVFRPQVQRLAFVRPLLGAVITRDDRIVAGRFVSRRRHQRWPAGSTRSIARTLARRILIKRIKRHPSRIGQDAVCVLVPCASAAKEKVAATSARLADTFMIVISVF